RPGGRDPAARAVAGRIRGRPVDRRGTRRGATPALRRHHARAPAARAVPLRRAAPRRRRKHRRTVALPRVDPPRPAEPAGRGRARAHRGGADHAAEELRLADEDNARAPRLTARSRAANLPAWNRTARHRRSLRSSRTSSWTTTSAPATGA